MGETFGLFTHTQNEHIPKTAKTISEMRSITQEIILNIRLIKEH